MINFIQSGWLSTPILKCIYNTLMQMLFQTYRASCLEQTKCQLSLVDYHMSSNIKPISVAILSSAIFFCFCFCCENQALSFPLQKKNESLPGQNTVVDSILVQMNKTKMGKGDDRDYSSTEFTSVAPLKHRENFKTLFLTYKAGYSLLYHPNSLVSDHCTLLSNHRLICSFYGLQNLPRRQLLVGRLYLKTFFLTKLIILQICKAEGGVKGL